MSDPEPPLDLKPDAVERRLKLANAGEAVICDLTVAQHIEIGILDLWQLLVTPEHLARWFAPVSGELRLGGTFQIEDNAHGTIEVCDPPFAFQTTWEFGGGTTHLHVTLDEIDRDCTLLSLRHVGLVPAVAWREYGPGAVGIGWDLVLFGLAHHLATGSLVPVESTTWVTSDEARSFINHSSLQWAEQSIAAGTPDFAARTAEARAASFFTGQG